jgi:hypothetical protein
MSLREAHPPAKTPDEEPDLDPRIEAEALYRFAHQTLYEATERLEQVGDKMMVAQSRTWAALGVLGGVGVVGIGTAFVATSPVVVAAAASLILLSGVVAVAYAASSLGIVSESVRSLGTMVRDRTRELEDQRASPTRSGRSVRGPAA